MKRLKLTLSTVLILLFFGESGFAQDFPNLNYYKSAKDKIGLSASSEHRVVFMGNSITQGWSETDPAFFNGKPYINRGISGQTTPQMLSRFQVDVVNVLPTVVVILAGTNDIAGNSGPTTVKKIQGNIASMAQLAKTNGIQVVLCSVLPVYKYPWSQAVNPIDSISSLNSLIKTYAQENEMIYADFYSPMVNEQKGLKTEYSGDGVHPNLAGYRVMNPIVEEAIDNAFILAGITPVLNLKDITDQPGTITAQGENQPNELKDYAFDNDNTTKWFDLANANPTTRSSWIQYQSSGSSYVVTQYTITSADDFPDRDPKSWSLLGSNNGSEWTTLDTKTNEEFSSRSLKNTYTFTNSAAYSYYRLQISSVNNLTTSTGVQLAELEILGIPAVTSVALLPTVLNLDKNEFKQLYARVAPSSATSAVTWSSSDDTVATVSSTGLVMAKAAGSATITVTSANSNKTATCAVTVYNSGFTKFEAESATLTGVWKVIDQQGYSGTGFVANFGNTGNSVQFSITGASAGNQYITLRYATAVGGTIHLYVNGTVIRQVTLANTGSWGNWTDKEDAVTLNAGNNTIKYQKDAGDGGHLNVDYLAVRDIETGIIDISNDENSISLFPNPLSNGSLSIKLPESTIRLSFFDVTGKMVYQQQVTKNELLIDQSVFKSEGVYVVNVMTSTNSINRKLIVTK
jgi:lysophospholipase L1-like esterase